MMTTSQGFTRREAIVIRMKEIDREIERVRNRGAQSTTQAWDNTLEVKDLEKEWIDLDDKLRALDGDG